MSLTKVTLISELMTGIDCRGLHQFGAEVCVRLQRFASVCDIFNTYDKT
jgi:hypothetical protein